MKVYAGILGCVALLLALFALPREDSIFRIRAGRERAVEEGMERLDSPRFEDRERALTRLVSLGEAARPRLEAALESEHAEVRMRAFAALRALDRARETPEERRGREYDHIIRIGLAKSGGLKPGTVRYDVLSLSPGLAAGVAARIAAQAEADILAHQRVVVLLRRLGRPEAADYLARALARGWWIPSTTYHLADGLIVAGGPEQLPLVREAVRSADPQTRRYAVRVLGRLGGVRDADLVREALRDPEPNVRTEAALALPALVGESALDALLGLAVDPDAAVRAAAVTALAKIPGAPYRNVAFRALSDRAPAVREAGLALLEANGDATDGRNARALLLDPDAAVRGAAIRALSKLGLAEAAVTAGIADESYAVRREAVLAARGLPHARRRRALARLPETSGDYLLGLRETVLAARAGSGEPR